MSGFAIDDQGIHIFAFTLHWYGIILVASAWIAAEVASWLAARDSREAEHVWRGLIWVSLGALIGARLWFVLFPPDSVVANGRTASWFLTHFFDLNQGVIAVWTGGLGLIGGIVGGLLGLLIYARRNRLAALPWLDIAAVALSLGQAIGRWAEATTQELYGPVTDLPWGMLVNDASKRVAPYTDLARYPLETIRFHPVFAYESLWSLLVFVVLLVAFLRYRGRLRAGHIALLYVALYGAGRFLLEFLRINVSHVMGLNVSQTVAAIAALIAAVLLLRTGRTSVLQSAGGSSHTIDSSLRESSLPSDQ
jgi:phosphatidylglycerol---prolipoprotein diacylglyceryl transferase